MTWRQFWLLTLPFNIAIVAFIAFLFRNGMPHGFSIILPIFLMSFSVLCVTLILMLVCHIVLYLRAMMRGNLPPMSKESRWTLIITGIMWFFFIQIFLLMGEGASGSSPIAIIGFVLLFLCLVGAFISLVTILTELSKFRSIYSHREKD